MHISRHQLPTTFKMIQILNPWQSARRVRTGTNGRRQLKAELASLTKIEVFSFSNTYTFNKKTFPVSFKWGFVRKGNEKMRWLA